MIDMGPISEHVMVLAFLRGEIDSPRFRRFYLEALQQIGGNREVLIDNPDPNDPGHNGARAYVLNCARGPLFQRFPVDVAWRRCAVTLNELGEFLYANFPTLLQLSGKKRSVREGAANYVASNTSGLSQDAREFVAGIAPIIAQIRAGREFPELIAVRDNGSPQIVLMEGHTRATAYVITGAPQSVPVLLGASRLMHNWWLF